MPTTRAACHQDGGPAHASAVLAVNVKPLRGRFANVDRSARRRLFGRHVSLVRKAACGPLSLTKEHGGDLPRRQAAVTPKAPKRSAGAAKPLDGGLAEWPNFDK
jgi:hypothetical protein